MSVTAPVSNDTAIVEKIEHLAALFQERAEDADRGGPLNDILRSNIHHLARMGFYGGGIPKEFGGLELSSVTSSRCAQLLSAACGVTAFTQQQLHAGGNFIGRCSNEELRHDLLPKFVAGENLCGVGFSHLRRPGPPIVSATPTFNGYIINGKLPWITAWSILDSFILGATVTDGSMIFAYLPIKEFKNSLYPGIPMQLSVMESSDTVELSITDLHLPAKYLIYQFPADHITVSDYKGIAGHIDMPLGCARGSAGLLRSLSERRKNQRLIELADMIERDADQIARQANYWNGALSEDPTYFVNAMKARTGAISLAIKAASAGVAASSGSAHLRSNPAQRRFRESAFYATQAQTQDIQNSLLEAFING